MIVATAGHRVTPERVNEVAAEIFPPTDSCHNRAWKNNAHHPASMTKPLILEIFSDYV